MRIEFHNLKQAGPKVLFALLLAAAVLAMTSCVPPPNRYTVAEAETTVQPPPPPTEVYFYPNRGQGAELQNRDSYECYLWSVKQTGFDPSAPGLAPHHKLVVVPEPPPGAGTAVGAVAGAVLGAAVASRGNKPEGILAGAVAGAIIGSASDAARREEADRIQGRYDQRTEQRIAEVERQATRYRRAMSACLEGRGYTVR